MHANSKMIEEVGTCQREIRLSTKGGNCETSTAKDILEESERVLDYMMLERRKLCKNKDKRNCIQTRNSSKAVR